VTGGAVAEDAAAGVPLTTPVLGSRFRPVGRAGLTLYEVAGAPVALTDGTFGVIATPIA